MSFSRDTFVFLDELALNNERSWFEANKHRYETHVREPALAFIRAMAAPLAELAPRFVADDKKVGGSLMRVYRDTRFGGDKTPYKTNIGIQFRHGAAREMSAEAGSARPSNNVHAPGYYVHVSPSDCFVGLGMWRPEAPILLKVRQKEFADEPERWTAAANAKGLALGDGDKLTRVPKGFDKSHPMADELRRTSFILMAPLTARHITGKGFVAHVAKQFVAGAALMRFLCEAAGVAF